MKKVTLFSILVNIDSPPQKQQKIKQGKIVSFPQILDEIPNLMDPWTQSQNVNSILVT